MKNVVTRALSGAVYIALIVLSILSTIYTEVPFLVLFSIIIAIGIWEFKHLADDASSHSALIGVIDIIGGIALFLSIYDMCHSLGESKTWMMPVLVYAILRIVVQLFMPNVNAIKSFGNSVFALCYVALPIGLLNVINYSNDARMLLAVFIFIWIFDTGAFCVGSLFGRHRLFERISPKKSWEGFWGGILFCIFVAVLCFYCFNEFFRGPDLTTWIGLGIVVAIGANFGDLFESLIKRTAGVKDSGKLIPGHGGILDRVDSLLFVAPLVLFYFMLITSLRF